jgi:hypothetical protein
VRWLTSINNDANMLPNFVNDSSAAKALLRCLQKEVYGAPRAIAVIVPTRFATNYFVMQGVQWNKAAPLQACSDDAWTDLGGKPKEAQEVLQRSDFWRLLSVAIKFLRPFSDFILQIEADRPVLARMYGFDDAGHACQEQHEALGTGQGDAGQLFSWAPKLGAQTGQPARRACSSSAEPCAHRMIPTASFVLLCPGWRRRSPERPHGKQTGSAAAH